MRPFPNKFRDTFAVFKELDSPDKIQDFVERVPINFETQGYTCRSPCWVLQHNQAQCIEGAMLAAAAWWFHGHKPLLLDLKTMEGDDDHVVALFKQNNRWGAISKTNHAVLRYRDPVYATIRELALSYFNEYFLDSGIKTLRSYSAPFSLLAYDEEWLTSEQDLWAIPEDLDDSRHFNILPKTTSALRPADPIEIKAGKLIRWNR